MVAGLTMFRPATMQDVRELHVLVNSAYRGDSSRAGWTTEADLLGGQRTDEQELAAILQQPDSMILLAISGTDIIGCVELQRRDSESAYLGMLVIRPSLQGQGLGSRLMAGAERVAHEKWAVRRIHMQVISLRHELIAYYERRGYRRTGVIKPFPEGDPRFGLPKVSGLCFEVLEKDLPT